MIFVNLAKKKKKRSVRLPEVDAGALKHVGVLTVHEILFYMCMLSICWSG